jgi:hypothetical protein
MFNRRAYGQVSTTDEASKRDVPFPLASLEKHSATPFQVHSKRNVPMKKITVTT